MTTWRKERIKHALSYIVVFALVFLFMASIVFLFSLEPEYTSKQGIYKGYLRRGDRYIYPVVEIDGKEVTSVNSQLVRDDAYIGSVVTVTYLGNDVRHFIVQW